MINAIIPIWKPLDWTSFDVVKKIRNQIKPAKVGHAGTLDPFAEGVLMICTGYKTKLVESFMDQEKEYVARIQLGCQTDTLDPTGKIVKKEKIPKLDEVFIKDALSCFIGKIMQIPPMYSALKYAGLPLYKYARKGIAVELPERRINIYDIKLIDFSDNIITIIVKCGRGTYIRSLARDIARQLGSVGYLSTLKRTRIGNVDQKKCLKIKEFPKWLSTRI